MGDTTRNPQYWYLAYHTIFWLDFYSSGSFDGFIPPAPFGLEEMDSAGLLPDRVYSQDELHSYLERGRNKSRRAVESLTEKNAHELRNIGPTSLTRAELLPYIQRHVQHHAAQLYLLLRQNIKSTPRWVFIGRE